MKIQNNIAHNLTTLRQLNQFSQEQVAEQIGVSRQVGGRSIRARHSEL